MKRGIDYIESVEKYTVDSAKNQIFHSSCHIPSYTGEREKIKVYILSNTLQLYNGKQISMHGGIKKEQGSQNVLLNPRI